MDYLPRGKDRWEYIREMRNQGHADDQIASDLKYSSTQSMWNWISRNRRKYEDQSDESLMNKILHTIAGDNKTAYFAGMMVGTVLRGVLDVGIKKLDLKNQEISLISSVWISFFLKGSFKKGLAQGLGLKDVPALVGNLRDWFNRNSKDMNSET